MTKNINYLKINDERLNLIDDGINYTEIPIIDDTADQELLNDEIINYKSILSLSFYNNNYDENHLISIFSSFRDVGFEIYCCIVQDDGEETDEFISCHENTYVIYDSIIYDSENDIFTVILIS